MTYNAIAEVNHPTPSSLKLVKDVTRAIAATQNDFHAWFSSYASNHRRRIAFDIDYVQHYTQKHHAILEFGAVPLLLTAALHQLGYPIQGVDIAPERFQTAIDALNLNVAKCDIEIESLPFPDNAFDCILFNEIFEHLRINLIFTLQEVFRVIRPGGLLMLSTPNLRSLNGILNFILRDQAFSCIPDIYTQYEKLQTLGHMGHVREYTTTEVCQLLEKIGFRIQSALYRGQYPQRYQRAITRLIPGLRPIVTIIATKPQSASVISSQQN